MSTRLYFGNPDVVEFRDLVGSYARSEFESRTRSTIPLLAWWKRTAARLDDLADQLKVPELRQAGVHFEYKVAPVKGLGKASHTDVMCVAPDSSGGERPAAAVAVEGKWTEPRYTTVGDWLGPSATPNRKAVLDGWLGLIQDRTQRAADRLDLNEVVYQLVHRTASACALGAKRTFVVLQHFSGANAQCRWAEVREDLRCLVRALSLRDDVLVYLQAIDFKALPPYGALESQWPALSEERRPEAVSEMLTDDESAFEFLDSKLERIL